ncbi:MAG: hypothetical protein J6Y44_00100, partial [Clostridia bacterium]|nr:hypothetical protein [Clostridia bacterium]
MENGIPKYLKRYVFTDEKIFQELKGSFVLCGKVKCSCGSENFIIYREKYQQSAEGKKAEREICELIQHYQREYKGDGTIYIASRQNKEYIIFPFNKKEKIKTIAVNKAKVDYIIPGQHAELLLKVDKNAKEETLFVPGNILSSEKFPIPCVKKFKAHIKTYDLKTIPITLGQKMMFYLQGQQKPVTIKKIERIFKEGSK